MPQVALSSKDGASVLGDRSAEVFEGDRFGFGAASLAGVEVVDGGDLFGGQVEVEDVEVFCDALRLGRCLTLPAAMSSCTVPATSSIGTSGSTRC